MAIWRWWSEHWKIPRRARWLYVAMAFGFGGLAVMAGLSGEGAIAGLAGAATFATLALGYFAPRLARWTEDDR